MPLLRVVVVVLSALLGIYTALAVSHEGANFFPKYIQDLLALGWSGQIGLDLACFTALSGLWIAWRHGFKPVGVVLGLIAVPCAWLFFGPYLLVATLQARGDWKTLLLGEMR